MALNKKSCARIAAILDNELGPRQAGFVLRRITSAADTDNKSFRKTMKRIAKALVKKPKAIRVIGRAKAA